MAERVILTGLPGSGKSTLSQAIVQHAREVQLDLKGVLSPPVFESGEKTAIDLLDLASGERTRLAKLRRTRADTTLISTQRWAFDPNIVEKGEEILHASTPCELLVIDELGPLEFERGEGWLAGLTAVDSGNYQSALVVVRPRLLEYALNRWPDARQVEIQSVDQVPALLIEILSLLGLPG